MTSFRDLAAADQLRVWEGVHGRAIVGAGPEGAVVVEAFSPPRDDWAGLEQSGLVPRWPR